MENPLAHLIRRHRRFAIPLHLNPVVEQLEKRLTPDQLASIQSELSASANRAASTAQRPVAATTRGGANAASISTTLRSSVSSFSAAPSYTVGQPLANTPSSSAVVSSSSSIAPVPSSTTSSAVRAIPSSSSSSVIPTTSTVPSSSSLPQVITRTQTPVTSISDALPSASAATANASSSSSSLSTGAVVGIVLAVLVGVVVLGSACGWAYRKFATRGYKSDSRWRKLDEDVTPFPMEKDEGYNDDIYGGSAAPVIGSRRALADHAGARPMSEYSSNRAGFGAGVDNHGQYPAHPSMGAYGVDAQGRPYTGTAGRVPAQIPYHDDQYDYAESHSPSSPPSSRQLVGPGAHAGPQLVPVAMGRPAPPRSYSDIASREDFADEPPSAGLPYGEHYEPMTAETNEWAGSAQSQPLPAKAPTSYQTTGPAAPAPYTDSPPSLAPMPLPTFAPLSPLMSGFDMNRQSQPLAMYENEPARQKQLYGEVAAVAGFPEPKTPHSAGLDFSVSSHGTFNTGTTHSSFSATEHGVRLPPVPVPAVPQINAPAYTAAPYEHGRPLSPLVEVSTPSTITSTLPTSSFPISSSSIGHARELNPFDRLPVPSPATPETRSLVAPHSAASTIPSPRYPPPSPGGMSLPGSVSDSPRRWSGNVTPGQGMARRSRGESMFDGEDAYGGI